MFSSLELATSAQASRWLMSMVTAISM